MWDKDGGMKDGRLLSKDLELDDTPELEDGRTEESGCSKLLRGRREAYGLVMEGGREDPNPMG